MSNIDKHNFTKKTLDFLKVNDFTELTLIQDAVVDKMIAGKDIIAVADTGTGKTHAFLIPLMEKIDTSDNRTQAIITAPTRELAYQIFEFAKVMSEVDETMTIELVTGGMDRNRMVEKLSNNPHIVIGTPGRIKDMFVDQAVLRADLADYIIVDEADMTFEFGFLEDIDQIVSRMRDDIQITVFSATILKEMNYFLDKYLSNPETIRINRSEDFSPNIDHLLIATKHLSYEETLLQLLGTINPYVCVIFCKTREEVENTTNFLRSNNLKTLMISGGLSSRERIRSLKDLRSQEFTYIVATDIAARGLDIAGITHVISLGLPSDLNFYTHRAGRTGRSQRHGTSYVIYNKSDVPSIFTLKNRGVKFQFKQVRNNELVDAKSLFSKKKDNYSEDKEIAKVLFRKNTKVKPGYKKKRQQEIDKIKQKRRRQMIKDDIKSQQKERHKNRQLAKRK
ncbi:MAG: DEAD/DEAH box helicase [Erysipelothrix sp.]|nr:DEAD/DEAH box helicase [Erysipelothrix sp.]